VLRTDNFSVQIRYTDGSVCTLLYSALGYVGIPKEYCEIYVDGQTLIMTDYKSLTIHGADVKPFLGQSDKGHYGELEYLATRLMNQSGGAVSMEQLGRAAEISFEVEDQITVNASGQ
jgi:hypothetical protein